MKKRYDHYYVNPNFTEPDIVARERNRISQHIHDEVIGNLTMATIEMELFSSQEKGSTPIDTKEIFDKIYFRINRSINSLRSLLQGSLEKKFTSSNFNSAISDLCINHNSIKGIAVNFNSNQQSFELSDDQMNHIFLIIQELLTNSIKHSNATGVEVSLFWRPKSVVLQYRDNGKGVIIDRGNSLTGYGIAGIIQRSNDLGANHRFSKFIEGMGFSLDLINYKQDVI